MNKDIQEVIVDIEEKLQNARGDLSRYEYSFPTDSPEHQLIIELLERLDEASDPKVIEENVRDYSDDYEVDRETVLVGDLREGDIILSVDAGEPFEVLRLDGWHLPGSADGKVKAINQVEITGAGWGKEEDAIVLPSNLPVTIAIRG